MKILKIVKISSQIADVVKVLTEDFESSCMFLHFMLHQLSSKDNKLENKIKWIRDQIIHSTNQIFFPLLDIVPENDVLYIRPVTEFVGEGQYTISLLSPSNSEQPLYLVSPFFFLTILFLCYICGTWRLEEKQECLSATKFDKSISLWKAIIFIHIFFLMLYKWDLET